MSIIKCVHGVVTYVAVICVKALAAMYCVIFTKENTLSFSNMCLRDKEQQCTKNYCLVLLLMWIFSTQQCKSTLRSNPQVPAHWQHHSVFSSIKQRSVINILSKFICSLYSHPICCCCCHPYYRFFNHLHLHHYYYHFHFCLCCFSLCCYCHRSIILVLLQPTLMGRFLEIAFNWQQFAASPLYSCFLLFLVIIFLVW